MGGAVGVAFVIGPD
ncbi:hypothetical protein YPPY63_2911, partial [Yersinia pestis PY-63]